MLCLGTQHNDTGLQVVYRFYTSLFNFGTYCVGGLNNDENYKDGDDCFWKRLQDLMRNFSSSHVQFDPWLVDGQIKKGKLKIIMLYSEVSHVGRFNYDVFENRLLRNNFAKQVVDEFNLRPD